MKGKEILNPYCGQFCTYETDGQCNVQKHIDSQAEGAGIHVWKIGAWQDFLKRSQSLIEACVFPQKREELKGFLKTVKPVRLEQVQK